MDSELTSVVAIVSPIISALFGGLMFVMKQRAQDWKDLYTEEKKDHRDDLKLFASEHQENSRTLRELGEFVRDLPRRREDWQPRGEQR